MANETGTVVHPRLAGTRFALVVLGTWLAGVAACDRADRQSPASGPSTQPLEFERLVASIEGDFYRGYGWRLTIEKSGHARLEVRGQTTSFEIDPKAMDELRSMLASHRFDQLQPKYGAPIPDGATHCICVEWPGHSQKVTVYQVMNFKDRKTRREVRRFLDVWVRVRSLFEDASAVDDRKEIAELPD